jgi:hypothetical protein
VWPPVPKSAIFALVVVIAVWIALSVALADLTGEGAVWIGAATGFLTLYPYFFFVILQRARRPPPSWWWITRPNASRSPAAVCSRSRSATSRTPRSHSCASCATPARACSARTTYNRGEKFTARQLSNQLRTYGIRSKTVRIKKESAPDKTPKGFEVEAFRDAIARYLSDEPEDDEEESKSPEQVPEPPQTAQQPPQTDSAY